MIRNCVEHYNKYPDEFFNWCSVTHNEEAVQFVKGYSNGDEYKVLEISYRKSLKEQVQEEQKSTSQNNEKYQVRTNSMRRKSNRLQRIQRSRSRGL